MSEGLSVSVLKSIFRFPFRGPGWQGRFLMGSVFILASFLIPVLPLLFVAGYGLAITRRAIRGETLDLPAWQDWGRLAMDGLRGGVVSLVYLLPGTLVMGGGMVVYFAAVFGLAATESFAGRYGGPEPMLIFLAMAIMFLATAVGLLLQLLGAIPLPVAMVHFVRRDRVAAAFYVREWWPLLWANALGWLVTWVVIAGLWVVVYLGLMVAYYTICLCCLVPFLSAPLLFYVWLVAAALLGQTYRESAAIAAGAEVTS